MRVHGVQFDVRLDAPHVLQERVARRSGMENELRRAIAEEEADARGLYKVLAEIGGEALVGPFAALDPGVYYSPRNGN